MRNHREDVVDQALRVLDTYGLADLTMRRLAKELGVQPSALYHHFPSKQLLLAAVADELLARGARPEPDGTWEEQSRACCTQLRDAMLAYRDGAEVVATVHAFGLGAQAPERALADAVAGSGAAPDLVRAATRTLLHLVFGHTLDEQTHLQAGSAGAIDDDPRDRSDLEVGVGLVLDGIRARTAAPHP
ncbi:TetR family transcriptional regulator [Nocardioides marmotae]|uniref:TetR family transcriptional regulator n=1 Tax=Nocardioides marmotae TaxID=2663857 RepID=UPI00132311F4|nr:TetR family transcriptional regulator [Nocardioides marmotae]MBC9735047.1 TetR family transcriptional regulator [Nocardioides marmotae]MTB86147.1 TetR family transcriptional regulator [Nocardioides marmotae]